MSWGEALFLKKVIDGRKRFVASDATIGIAYDGQNHSFTPKIDGVIRVSANIENSSSISGSVVIRLKNVIDATEQESAEFSMPSKTTETGYADFSIKKGKTYQVEIKRTSTGGIFNLLKAEYKGQIVDNNYFSIGGDE